MTSRVKCYAGSAYPEKPRAVEWEDTWYTVLEIIHQYREPAGIGFLVRCSPMEKIFDLFYTTETATWHIKAK